MPITTFEAKYETAPGVPPPYCHYYILKARVTPEGIDTRFDWVYHNREDLTAEEIEDEGFTANDDFAWQGKLSKNWLPPLEKLLRKTKQTTAAENDDTPYLELDFRTTEGGFNGTPDRLDEWTYLLQELVQCVYETAGKEAPLQIRYKKITPGESLYGSVRMQFSDRTVTLQTRTNDSKMRQSAADWEIMKNLLETVFSLDYLPEKAETREPHQPGVYVDAGEGSWYALGKAALDPAKSDALTRIEKAFDRLVR
jgi:hypothetical protein